jgi:hypothetical protein
LSGSRTVLLPSVAAPRLFFFGRYWNFSGLNLHASHAQKGKCGERKYFERKGMDFPFPQKCSALGLLPPIFVIQISSTLVILHSSFFISSFLRRESCLPDIRMKNNEQMPYSNPDAEHFCLSLIFFVEVSLKKLRGSLYL